MHGPDGGGYVLTGLPAVLHAGQDPHCEAGPQRRARSGWEEQRVPVFAEVALDVEGNLLTLHAQGLRGTGVLAPRAFRSFKSLSSPSLILWNCSANSGSSFHFPATCFRAAR